MAHRAGLGAACFVLVSAVSASSDGCVFRGAHSASSPLDVL